MKRIVSIFLFLVLFMSFAELMAQPSPPILVSPTNGATNVSLFPTFDWADVSGATSYRIQVFQGANTVLDVSNITSSQYSVTTAVLQGNTSYYWRVNATGGSGTSGWSSQWTFTTVVVAPSIPVLSSPPNGSTGVSLTPVLTWNASQGATQYRVQVSTNPGFTSNVVDVSGLANTGYVIQSGVLSNGVQYYWRVNASNIGGTSDWSTAWNFTTIVAPPSAPTLLSPPNTATNVTVTPTLDWSDVGGVTGYKIQVALNSSFTALVFDETVTTSQVTLPSGTLSGQTLYYWRVAAINSGGQGNYTTPWSFTTIVAPPAAPFLSAPPNNATGVSRTVTLDWNTVPTATSYRVQVSTNPGFTSTVVNMVTGSTSSYSVPYGVLSYNTQYYWRVNASNAGGTGVWSAVWNFTTTIQAPAAPTLIAPTNGSTGQSLTPLFDWSDVSGANSYRVQISTSLSFNTTVLDVNNVAQSEFNVPSGILTGNTLYYWRVAGINTGGQGSYSTTWNFSTLNTFYLNLKVYLEGFWNGTKQVKDTVKVYLANPTSPFTLRDSSAAFIDSTGSALISLGKAPNGNYYIIIKHRNHLETWSSTAPSFATGSTSNYDFTTAATKAYGSNMKQVGSVWVLYGGDGNADGFVNPDDYILYRQQFGRDGYRGSDYNGDGFVDGYDLPIIYSNFGKSYSRPF